MTAITPLNELYPEDINAVRNHVDTWLRGHTHNMVGIDDLAKILETLPVSGNVMAAVDVVYDISDLVDRYKTQGIDLFDWANLGIDLIGVIPAPATASVRVVARPALKLVREEFKKQVKKAGQEQLKNQAKQGAKQDTAQLLGDAILTVLGNHINEKVAGDIENFCTSGLAQLNSVLTGCGQHIQKITDTTNQGVIRVVNTGQVYTNADANMQGAQKQLGGMAKGVQSGDIGRVATNFVYMTKNLGKALIKTQANATGQLASRVLSFAPETKQAILKIGDNIRVFGVSANKKVVGLGNPNELQSIGWLFKKLLDSAVVYRKKKPPKQQTQIKQNQTATAQRNNNNGQLESTNLQANAKTNANGCKNGTATSTGCAISFAMGTETVLHEDAQIHPLFTEQLLRSYSSDLYQYDHGMFGARWITPFTTAIVPRTEYDEANPSKPKQIGGFEYIGLDGRAIELHEIKHGESYFDAVENFTYSHISDDLKAITFGQTHQIYKLDKTSKTYRLVSIMHEHDFTVGVRYDHIVDGKTYLSDIVFKQGEKELAHVGFQLNTQCKVAVAWRIENGQLGRVLAQYGYDEYGNLVQAVNEFGQSHEYAYDHHLITRYTDLTGRGMNLAYDGILPSSKAVAEWADDHSAASQLEWDANIRKTTVRDLQGNETEHYYGLTGYTYRTVYPDGLQEWFFRDADKNVTTHIGLDGSETHYTYDKRGNVLTMTQPDGCTLHYSYDESDRLIGHVDAEHGKWLKEYDEKGNLIRELDPLKNATHYRYNDLGLPVSIQDAKGGIKQLQYDKQGNLVRYVDCSGKAMQWEYDARNRVTCVTNALREKVTYHYSEVPEKNDAPREPIAPNLPLNAIGQLERISHPDGSEEYFIHDAEGRLLVHIDAKEQQTKYEYNQAGLITQRTDAMGQTLKYTWDILSRLTCLTNENGARYQFEYDAMGRLLSETDFDGKRTEYKYDAGNGQLTTSIEIAKRYGQKNDTLAPKDRIQQFVFDSMGRLEQRTAGYGHAGHDLEHAQSEEFAYDGRGQLIKAKNAHSEIQWVYDAIGNLTREHHHDFTTKKTAVWKHVYDEIHDRVRTVRPDGQTLNWMTYGSGHVYGLAVNGDDLVTFERDDLHRETLRHYANGLTMSQSYDVMGRLHQQNIINYHKNSYGSQATPQTTQNNTVQDTKNLIERIYKYDRTGQLTNIKDSRRGNFSYHYDPVGRLIDATSKLGRETFEFDPASNLLDKNAFDDGYASTETKRQPHIVDNIVKQYLDSKYEYDAFGQLIQQNNSTTQGTLRLEWDVFGRMIKSRNGQHTAQYRYDALGRRIAKTTTQQHTGQSQSTVYGWDGDTLAYESTDQKTTHYVYEKDSFVPLLQINYDQAVNLHTTPQWSKDEPYNIYADPLFNSTQSAVDLTRIYYYHCDHLGTPQELSNSMAQVVWQGQYKVWGKLVSAKHRFAQAQGESSTREWERKDPSVQQLIENSEIITNNLRFQGQYFDLETGLHYNRYRYYSPEVGRFISKDPIGLAGGLNGYAYAPNPIGWVDPLGLNRNKNPNNWLQHHEGGSHNGHTIDRHVGKKDCELKSRLDNSKTKKMPKGISGSGSYPNQKVAENTISKAFKQVNPDTGNTYRKDVKNWVKAGPAGVVRTKEINYSGADVIGRGIKRNETQVIDRKNAKVIVRTMGDGKYSILTSYPN